MHIDGHFMKLRQLGLVPTIQRVAVLEMLQDNHSHPTPGEVYQGVKDQFPSIARATVYNTLDALKKAGTIQELTIAREATRYDYDPSSHPHFSLSSLWKSDRCRSPLRDTTGRRSPRAQGGVGTDLSLRSLLSMPKRRIRKIRTKRNEYTAAA